VRRVPVSDIVLKALGLLLLTAAALKGHQLLTVPVVRSNLWSWRPFLIFQAEFELALGMWLLSGVLKRLAWIVATACFGLFCCVTFFKGITGAESCGCFGNVHVDPWITLLAIDLPATMALTIFRPKRIPVSCRVKPRDLIRLSLAESRTKNLAMSVILIWTLSTIYLVNENPADGNLGVVGEVTPRLDYVRAEQSLETGYCLVGYVSRTCQDCVRVINELNEFAASPVIEGVEINVALIEKYPYSTDREQATSGCILGVVEREAGHQISSPMVELLWNGKVQRIWERSELKRGVSLKNAVREVIAAKTFAVVL
jgi:Methylamine utilisation protein MauE